MPSSAAPSRSLDASVRMFACVRYGIVSLAVVLSLVSAGCSESSVSKSSGTTDQNALWGDAPYQRPTCVKGIHLTAWYTGNKKARVKFEKLLADTELNTVVIDVKETEGDVFIPGVTLDGKNVYEPAMRDIKEYLDYLKKHGVYTIARIAVFHDNRLAKVKPEWAIRSSSPLPKAVANGYRADIWVDRKGSAWADPHNQHVWDYIISIGERAADIGFQEIQFDYIRFPSDGSTRLCIYSKPHSRATAVQALSGFLERAHKKLAAKNVPMSIDVFGLTGSYNDDLGIGQKLSELIHHTDTISPMMYPSHYNSGEFGLKDPDASPYETIHHSIRDTKKVIANSTVELRPWLQDFSLHAHYSPTMVRQQIDAAADLGIGEWLLWNPSCHYTQAALEPFNASLVNEGSKPGEAAPTPTP